MKRVITDEAEFRTLYQTMTIKQLAEYYQCHTQTIFNYEKRYGLSKKVQNNTISSTDKRHLRKKLPPDEELFRLFNDALSDQQIAEMYNCSVNTVRKKRYELTDINHAARILLNSDNIMTQIQAGMTLTQLTEYFHCSRKTISKFCRAHNIIIPEPSHKSVLISQDELQYYVDNGLSNVEIANKFGCSIATVKSRMREYGIQRFTLKDVPDERIIELVNSGATDQENADALGCCADAFRKRRRMLGLQSQGRNSKINNGLILDMVNDGMSDISIADYLKCSVDTVAQHRIECGIRRGYPPVNIDRVALEKLINQGYSMSAIARQFNCSEFTIVQRIEQYGLIKPTNAQFSSYEIYWLDWLNSLGFQEEQDYVCHDRTHISPYEIDIFIPEYSIGLEINPVFTHSVDSVKWSCIQKPKPNIYHQKKALLARQAGINLLNIYDWMDVDKIKDIIISNVQMNNRIAARKCHIIDVPKHIERKFLADNHMQGYVQSERCYGLVYNGMLYCLMSFGRPRFKSPENCQWELLRFASLRGYTIIGGASKLFTYFSKECNPQSVLSFCSLDVSNGKIYPTLGFHEVRITYPTYRWVNARDASESYSWKTVLDLGVDNLFHTQYGKDKSNIEAMLDLGFVRVYNAGNLVYTWHV